MGTKAWKSGFVLAEKQLLHGNTDKGVPGAELLDIFFSDLPCSEFGLRHPRDASGRGLWGQAGKGWKISCCPGLFSFSGVYQPQFCFKN